MFENSFFFFLIFQFCRIFVDTVRVVNDTFRYNATYNDSQLDRATIASALLFNKSLSTNANDLASHKARRYRRSFRVVYYRTYEKIPRT